MGLQRNIFDKGEDRMKNLTEYVKKIGFYHKEYRQNERMKEQKNNLSWVKPLKK
jgi:hypothetical protein